MIIQKTQQCHGHQQQWPHSIHPPSAMMHQGTNLPTDSPIVASEIHGRQIGSDTYCTFAESR